ncbi:MAG: S-adenosylmethionine decarboxylase [Planctomycetota bacterium]
MSLPLDPASPRSTSSGAPEGHDVGQEWAIDASGLDPARLAGERGLAAVGSLFEDIVGALGLHPVAEPIWHVFPGPHCGLTGLLALSESHLACHTFPEFGGLALSLYTCRRRREPDWRALVVARLAADPCAAVVRSRAFDRRLLAPEVLR